MARIISTTRRHPWSAAALLAGFAAFATFVVVYFAPQDLFIDTSVNEPFPTASAGLSAPPSGDHAAPSTRGSQRDGPSVLARGRFRSGEHHTSGTAVLVSLADGRTFVRIEDLDTSNGPDVRIWLSTAGYRASDDAVHAAAHLDLGGLKANHGNQNYLVAGGNVSRYRSVVVWCRRFQVVFGAAPLSPPTN